MPLDNAGNYSMNPQNAKMHDTAAAPVAPMAAEPQTVILSKNPDGSYSCDDGSGQPSMHQTLEDALSYVSQTFEGDSMKGDDLGFGAGPSGGSETLDGGQQGY